MGIQSTVTKRGLALGLSVMVLGAIPGLALSQDTALAAIKQAAVLISRGKSARALQRLDEALERLPDEHNLIIYKAEILRMEGRLPEARQMVDRALGLAPQDVMVRRTLASIQIDEGNDLAALATLNELIREDPQSGPLSVRAGLHAKLGNPKAAELDYRNAVRLSPEDVIPRSGLANFLLDEDRPRDALEEFNGILNIEPDNREATIWRIHILLEDLSRPDEAEPHLVRALKRHPHEGLLWALSGDLKLVRGDLAGSESDLSRAIKLAPDLDIAWMRRAVARIAQQRVDEGLEDLDRAIKIDSDNLEARLYRAVIYTYDGKLDEAEADVKRPFGAFPDSVLALNTQASLLYRRGKPDQALALFQKGLGLEPDNLDLRVNSALLLMENGHFAQAVAEFETAIPKAEYPSMIIALKAEALRQAGQLDQAELVADEAIQADPKLAFPWWIRSKIRQGRGDLTPADLDAKRALTITPDVSTWTTADLLMSDWWAY